MECQNSGLGTGIVDDTGRSHERCHACQANNVAFVLLEHVRQKLLDHPEMGYNVDLEDFGNPFVRGLNQRVGLANAGVVYQYGRIS